MNYSGFFPVILCGGSGSRLWPLARSGFPKQFLAPSGNDSAKSLFQQAVERLNAIGLPQIKVSRTLVVTNEEHRFLVLDQLRELAKVQVTLLLKLICRNTATALTLAALYASKRFKVKPIQVRSGATLSLQMYHRRAEHWIVVKGVPEITNCDQVINLTKNQSTYIPHGQAHRLANPGAELLEIIEVQSGV